MGFTLHGRFTPTKNAIQTLIGLFEALQAADPTFHERCAALPKKHGRKYLSLNRKDMFRSEKRAMDPSWSHQLKSGYYIVATNYGPEIERATKMACQVMNLTYGRDVILHLGEAGI
ncbi:MAG TPA: hypothetical protein DDX54_03550 [Rhodospirillaceae bacterium]|nr:hypothetical protein [Alphaproteobacteria bacterium]HBH26459.1 hypothetical protein [Rhodospirillaceae bacterium]